MKTTLINSMVSFTLGTGATLVALSTWLGTSDLQAIKSSVQNYVMEAEQNVGALLGEYNVVVDSANAEIGEYQVALEQANSNIDKLITAYESKVDELENANQQAEQDLADLQAEFEAMQTRLEEQYEADMNAIIEQANAQINQANDEVAETKEQVQEIIDNSFMSDIAQNGERNQLDTTGDKTVQDISGIVGEEQPAE